MEPGSVLGTPPAGFQANGSTFPYLQYGEVLPTDGIFNSQTLGGFEFLDSSVDPKTSISWIAFEGDASGSFGIQGVAATPLPAALPLFAGGLGALGLLGWRRKRNAKAVAST